MMKRRSFMQLLFGAPAAAGAASAAAAIEKVAQIEAQPPVPVTTSADPEVVALYLSASAPGAWESMQRQERPRYGE